MTQSDLRAAAERIVEDVYDHSGFFFSDGEEYYSVFNDAEKVAKEYLASHPPDGETEIDEAWLVSVGMMGGGGVFIAGERGQDWYWSVSVTSMEPVGDKRWHFRGNYYKAKEGQEEIVKFVKTRSDLRGLCRALGIPLREETKT